MKDYRYILEKGSKKHHCPECNKKRFVKYIDVDTTEHLPEQYGRCDRESKCGYHLNPYKDGYAKMVWDKECGNENDWKPQQVQRVKKRITKLTFIPDEILYKTRSGYERNVFIQNLLNNVDFPFEVSDIEKVISLYNLGTVQEGYRKGAITFPYIDINNNVRAIQVKQFDGLNHTIGTDFLHSIIEKYLTLKNKPIPEWLEAYNKNETKVSCLFGEHLLNKYPHNPVALVEAPKTAIYGALYFGFPNNSKNILWLAVYNLSSLNLNKCRALRNRRVILFPDLSEGGKAFDLWSSKAQIIQSQVRGSNFQVSSLLEQSAADYDRSEGKDIADYLIKQDWRRFRSKPKTVSILEKREIESLESKAFELQEDKPKNWLDEIKELEAFFSNLELPTQAVKLNKCTTITNAALFVDRHLKIVKQNDGNNRYLPYLERLQDFKFSVYNMHTLQQETQAHKANN